MKFKKHRIVTDKYLGFECQVWYLWFPFWVPINLGNTHKTLEKAKKFIGEPEIVWSSREYKNLPKTQNMTIIEEIKLEREKQDGKWGEQTHPCLDQTLLNREGGCTSERMCENYEIPSETRAKFMCDNSFENGSGTFAHIAVEELSEVISEFDIHKRREELIQLTAVCVAWIESIDRQILEM